MLLTTIQQFLSTHKRLELLLDARLNKVGLLDRLKAKLEKKDVKTMTMTAKNQKARKWIKVGIIFYAVPLVLLAIFADMTGSSQANITNTFATISGVLLALYSIVEEKKQLPVMVGLLLSILVSLMSSIASSDSHGFSTIAGIQQVVSLSKGLFVAGAFVFLITTSYFASSIAMEKFMLKKEAQAATGAALTT
ncbi:MAG TPA: hypothetical protein VFE98_00665 [Candidatus Bathyarchaeia archaeon]|nr:hypothetical protein [Candidatus Bathyarchaeia archaeon]